MGNSQGILKALANNEIDATLTPEHIAAAQSIMHKLHKIVANPNQNQKILALAAEEVAKLITSLATNNTGADELTTKLEALFTQIWQVNDEKLASMASDEFNDKYLGHLVDKQKYCFMQVMAMLVHLKTKQLNNYLNQIHTQLQNLDHTKTIIYKEEQFKLQAISSANINPAGLAACKKMIALIADALNEGILINEQSISPIDLLDNYIVSTAGKKLLAASPELCSQISKLYELYQEKITTSLYNQQRYLFLDIRPHFLNPAKFNQAQTTIKALSNNFEQLSAYVRQDIIGEFNILQTANATNHNEKQPLTMALCTIKMERWINIMQLCEKQANYHALSAIGTALKANEILHLKKARQKLSTTAKTYLAHYEQLAAQNYKRLRVKQISQYSTSEAVLPLFAVFLQNPKTAKKLATTPNYLKVVKTFGDLQRQREIELRSYGELNLEKNLEEQLEQQPYGEIFNNKLYQTALAIEPLANKPMSKSQPNLLTNFFSQASAFVRALLKVRDLESATILLKDAWQSLKNTFVKPKPISKSASIRKWIQLTPKTNQQSKAQNLSQAFLTNIVAKTKPFNPAGMLLSAADEVILDDVFGPINEPQTLPKELLADSSRKNLVQIFIAMIQADARLALRLTAHKQVMAILDNDEQGRKYIVNKLLCKNTLGLRHSLHPEQLNADIGSTFKNNEQVLEQISANLAKNVAPLVQTTVQQAVAVKPTLNSTISTRL